MDISCGVHHHLRVHDFLPSGPSNVRRDVWMLQSIHNVGVSAILWRTEHSFNSEDEKLMRLCLAVMGPYGYQTENPAGNGDFAELFRDDTFNIAQLSVSPTATHLVARSSSLSSSTAVLHSLATAKYSTHRMRTAQAISGDPVTPTRHSDAYESGPRNGLVRLRAWRRCSEPSCRTEMEETTAFVG